MTGNAKQAGHLAALVLTVMAASSLPAAEIESFTEPYRSIDVAAVDTGLIIAVHVREGDRVEPNQSLADLNQDVLRATLEIARVQRDATSSLKSAEAELRLKANRLKNFQELRKTSNATEEEVRQAELEKELAEAAVLAAKETLETRRLEYERIRLQLEQRTLRSPIDGFVTQVYKEIGEFVALTDPVVITVVQLDPLLVTFSVPASSASLKKGQKLPLNVAGQKKPVEGTVELVSPVITADSQTIRVRVRIPNPGFRLKSGLKCRLRIPDGPGGLARKPKSDAPKRN